MSKFYNYIKLLEGGAWGHLNNLWDNTHFTFGDIKNIINKSLAGKLEYVHLKTDGQQISFSWINNQIRFARNKGHLKNSGADSLTMAETISKFSGRGGLSAGFENAAKDLNTAIQNLTDKQKEKIFKNGKKFMSCEIMYTDSENIVSYGVNEIRFHGTKEYNDDGIPIDENKEDGRALAGMIKQIKQHKQSTFNIKSLEKVELPEIPNFDAQSKKFIKEINAIKSRFRLKDNNTISEYIAEYFKELMKKENIPYSDGLLKRWADNNKKYKISDIKRDYSDSDFNKIKQIDSNISQYYKDCIWPLEKISLDLGATVLENITTFMVLHPDKAKESIKNKMQDAIQKIRASENPNLMKKLNKELQRIESVGGISRLFPEEGITFIYKDAQGNDNFMKFTGLFAPLNALINLTWQLE